MHTEKNFKITTKQSEKISTMSPQEEQRREMLSSQQLSVKPQNSKYQRRNTMIHLKQQLQLVLTTFFVISIMMRKCFTTH